MSVVQRLVKRFFPGGAARMEEESRQWMVRCPNCSFEQSYWDMGGIRAGAAGNPKLYLKCSQCGERSWHTVYHKATPDTQPPTNA